MRMHLSAIFLVVALASALAPGLVAQGLSGTVAAAKPFYWAGDYRDTRGDWLAQMTIRYRFGGRLGMGVGAGGGKLDEADSDPSISFFWIHVEPSLNTQLTRSSRAWVGARYGLAHERVGHRDEGLWAWGWLGGVAGGLSYVVHEDIAIGLHVDVMRLDLRRDETGVAVPGGVDREGWRVSVGPEITIGGG